MSSNTSSDNTKMSSAAKTSTKKTTKATESVSVSASVPVVTATAAAVAPKAPKAAKATKTETAPVAAAPVVAAPVAASAAPAPVVATAAATEAVVADEDIGVSLTNSIAALHEQLSALKTAFGTAAATLKTVEKQAARVIKKADRRRKRKSEAVAGAEPKPCIFTKDVKVSDELCAFLGKAKGSSVSRSAVTKGVIGYAKTHNLMDKQTINTDAPLRKLLTLTEGTTLTILNLQKFLSHHYLKTAPIAAN